MKQPVKFQKRHFEFIAAVLRTTEAPENVIQAFANTLSYTNIQFNKDRFIKATKGDS